MVLEVYITQPPGRLKEGIGFGTCGKRGFLWVEVYEIWGLASRLIRRAYVDFR